MNKALPFSLTVAAGLFSSNTFAVEGMPTPMLHVEDRYLKNSDGRTVTLRGGSMQPIDLDGVRVNLV